MKVVQAKPKEAYRPPKLRMYGDLAQMTKAGATGSKNDHGGGNIKTA
jgi:hypothetical protein